MVSAGLASFETFLLGLQTAVLSLCSHMAFSLCIFLVSLGLYRCMHSCGEQGLLSSCGAWASFCSGFSCWGAWALEHVGFSSCSSWTQLLCSMWDLPGLETEPVFP